MLLLTFTACVVLLSIDDTSDINTSTRMKNCSSAQVRSLILMLLAVLIV